MLKLTILNKPKELLLKCKTKFPDVVLANLQEKEVTPSKEIQEVIADKPYDGLSKVIVDKIPEEYIIPVGTKEIETNGNYDVREYANASVNVPEKQLGTKTITANGTYLASDDNLDGYSSVSVETSGVDINDYFDTNIETKSPTSRIIKNFIKKTPDIIIPDDITRLYNFAYHGSGINAPKIICNDNVTSTDRMYYNSYYYNIDLSGLNLSKTTTMTYMLSDCSNLKTVDLGKKTSTPTTIERLCYNSAKIEEIDLTGIDTSKLTIVGYAFVYCSSLITFKGLKDIGQAYLTTTSANNWAYELNFSNSSKLSYESLITIINNLYDIATKGCNTQKLVLGSTNLAKLTAEEINVATERGWTVS